MQFLCVAGSLTLVVEMSDYRNSRGGEGYLVKLLCVAETGVRTGLCGPFD